MVTFTEETLNGKLHFLCSGILHILRQSGGGERGGFCHILIFLIFGQSLLFFSDKEGG